MRLNIGSKGIDVSDNNGVLDWVTVLNSGVAFAMIRVGCGSDFASQDDTQAIRNMQECDRLQIPYGAYLYSYCLNTDEASSEAIHALRMVKDFNPVLGVYHDMEDADGYKTRHNLQPELNGALLTNFSIIFMDAVIAAGYKTGVYANKNYFDNILETGRLDSYPKWLAIWGPDSAPDGDWTIWQNSSDGVIPGSSSRTDTNVYLKELELVDVTDVDPVIYEPIAVTPANTPTLLHSIGETVSYTSIYYTSGSWDAMTPTYTSGVITNIYEGMHNPYLINGGTGFVNDACIVSSETAPEVSVTPESNQGSSIGVGSEVIVTNPIDYDSGNHITCYANSYRVGELSADRAVLYSGDSLFSAVALSNLVLVDSGETQETQPITDSAPQYSPIVQGSEVVVNNPIDYDSGNTLTCYFDTYTVGSIDGDRAVLYKDGSLFSAVNICNLSLAQ